MNFYDKFFLALRTELEKEFDSLFLGGETKKPRQPSTKLVIKQDLHQGIWGRFMPTDTPEDNKNYCKAWYLRLKKDPKKYASRLAKQAENQRKRRAAQRSGHEKG